MKRDFLTYLKEAWNELSHDEDFIKAHPIVDLTDGEYNFTLTYDEKKKKYVGSDPSQKYKPAEIRKAIKSGTVKFGNVKYKKDVKIEPQIDEPQVDVGQGEKSKRDIGKNKEKQIQNSVNNWIEKNDDKKKNPNIDDIVDNPDDHFYSIQTGDNSSKSDIMVVHDKEEHNKNKIKVGQNDGVFYIEAKAGEDARTFNPGIKIVQNGSDDFQFEYVGSIIPDEITDHKEKLMYNDIMSKGDLGKIITEVVGKKAQPLLNTLKKIIELYKNIANFKDENVKESGYEFPRDFKYLPKIFDYVVKYSLVNKSMTDWNELDQFFKEINVNEKLLIDIYNKNKRTITRGNGSNINSLDGILEGLNDQQKKVYMFYLVNSNLSVAVVKLGVYSQDYDELNEDEKEVKSALDKITFAIKSWYCDHKKTAYLEVGPSKDHDGGIYIFDKNYDPLNLQEKTNGMIKTFQESVYGALCTIVKEPRNDTMRLEVKLKMIENGYQFEKILNDKYKMKPGDEKNDNTKFFKENM